MDRPILDAQERARIMNSPAARKRWNDHCQETKRFARLLTQIFNLITHPPKCKKLAQYAATTSPKNTLLN